MPQPNHVFVVDGGATKTEAELRTLDCAVLAAARTGPCNPYQSAWRSDVPLSPGLLVPGGVE